MEIKNSSSLEIFRLKTKSWTADKRSYWGVKVTTNQRQIKRSFKNCGRGLRIC